MTDPIQTILPGITDLPIATIPEPHDWPLTLLEGRDWGDNDAEDASTFQLFRCHPTLTGDQVALAIHLACVDFLNRNPTHETSGIKGDVIEEIPNTVLIRYGLYRVATDAQLPYVYYNRSFDLLDSAYPGQSDLPDGTIIVAGTATPEVYPDEQEAS